MDFGLDCSCDASQGTMEVRVRAWDANRYRHVTTRVVAQMVTDQVSSTGPAVNATALTLRDTVKWGRSTQCGASLHVNQHMEGAQ
jgi:hypothetical protein